MIKRLTYSGLNSRGEPGSDIIRPGELRTKMASVQMLPEMADFWRTQNPESDKFLYLLINIMGASEYWGLNLNGDGFTEPTLKKYHKTFMQAHAYWLHDNDDVKKGFGRVIFASYNDDMHRVELISRLDRKSGHTQEIETKMMAGAFPSVSMGCHVPWDRCLVCENIAKTKQEYCEHVRKYMRRLWPIGCSDGRRVGVDNPHPTFFDSSHVETEADPQSGILAKVASVDEAPYELSVDAGTRYLGKGAAEKLSEEKGADMDKPLDPSKYKYMPKVEFNQEAREVATLLDDSDPSISKEALDRLSFYPLEGIIHTAALMGISIRPEYGYLRAKFAGMEDFGIQLLKRRVNRVKIAAPESISYGGYFNREVASLLTPFIKTRSYFPSSFSGRQEKRASLPRLSMPEDWMEDYSIAVKKAMSIIASDPAIFYKTAWVNAIMKTACAGKSWTEEEWQQGPKKEAAIVIEMLSGAFRIDR
jgi:hypothetical protein